MLQGFKNISRVSKPQRYFALLSLSCLLKKFISYYAPRDTSASNIRGLRIAGHSTHPAGAHRGQEAVEFEFAQQRSTEERRHLGTRLLTSSASGEKPSRAPTKPTRRAQAVLVTSHVSFPISDRFFISVFWLL